MQPCFFLSFGLLVAFQAINTNAFTAIPTMPYTTLPTTQSPLNASRPQYICYLPSIIYGTGLYKMFVLVLNSKDPTEVSIYVNSRLQHKKNVTSGVPTIVTANLTHPRKSEVKLMGKGGVNFWKKVTVHVFRSNKPGPAFMVQMNQAVYYPNDKVRFRCFVLDTNLHLIKARIDIKIYDSYGNLIYAWYNQRSRTGVISKNFIISSRTCSFGLWRIILHQRKTNIKERHYFTVKKNIYEHAKVEISGDRYAYNFGTSTDFRQYLRIVVEARYSTGEPMIGTLHLQITLTVAPYTVFTRVISPFHGKFIYRYQLREFLNDYGFGKLQLFYIQAKVFEIYSQFRVSSKRHHVYITSYPLLIRKKYPSWLQQKRGLNNQYFIYARRKDGEFLNLQDIQGKMNVTFFSGNISISNVYCLPLDGVIRVDMPDLPMRMITMIYYGFHNNYQYWILVAMNVHQYSPDIIPIKASLINKDYYAGDEISVRVTCTSIILKIYYMVVKNHDIVNVGTRSTFGSNLIVKIKTNKDWYPVIKIFLNALTINNYVIMDMVEVGLKMKFEYKIEGQFLPSSNFAGTFTKLKMKSARRSTVFFMSVDERLERGRNEYISRHMIERKLFGKRLPIKTKIHFNLKSLLRSCSMNLASNVLIARGPYKRPETYMPNMPPIRKSAKQQKFCFNSRPGWQWRKRYFSRKDEDNMNLRVPNCIASWKTYAFAVHRTKGFSILEKPLEFNSYRKMCLDFVVPRCIFRNERFSLKVIVFNFLPFAMKVKVKFLKGYLLCVRRDTDKVVVPANSHRRVEYWVCSRNAGRKVIKVRLSINGKKIHEVHRSILVKYIGHTVYFSNEMRINLRSNKKHVMEIRKAGRHKVPKSTVVKIAVSGDIMAIVLRNLEYLVPLPTNCGEQIASIFAWHVYMYEYIRTQSALSWARIRRLESLIKNDYQNQLCYKRYKRSYSVFSNERPGNVWLTAFVLENFKQVIDNKMNVLIDVKEMHLSLGWLLRRQNSDGSFHETGRICHPQLQGQGKSSVPLTAFVVASLISLKNLKHFNTEIYIKKSEKYLTKQNLKKLDVYTLCILLYTYARLGNKGYFRKTEKILLRKATRGRDYMYWKGEYDVEQTGYVLLAYSYKKDLSKGKKILAWLLSKRNSFGGFSNTQNTAVCMKAFAKFGRYLNRINYGKIHFYTDLRQQRTVTYRNKKSLLRLYISRLQRQTQRVYIQSKSKGSGMATIKLSWKYNLDSGMNAIPGLHVKVTAKLKSQLLLITICYKMKNKKDPGMLISEIQLPSGYVKHKLDCGARTCDKFKNCSRCVLHSEDLDGELVLYLEKLKTNKLTCVIIEAMKQFAVSNRRTKLFVTTTAYYTNKKCIRSYRLPR